MSLGLNMRKTFNIKTSINIWLYASALAFGVVCLSGNPSAAADNTLFQTDSNYWTPVDHYHSNADAGEPAPTQIEAAPVATQATTMPQALAAPVSPAVDPNINKGFKVQITSTDSDKIADQIAAATILAEQEGDPNWRPLPLATKGDTETNGDGTKALPVRLTYLPKDSVPPIPSISHDSALKAGRVALKMGALEPPKPTDQPPPAVCAAIAAYKQQQLSAIQGDRETLKALQNAIHTLGLESKLSFMTGAAETAVPKSTTTASAKP